MAGRIHVEKEGALGWLIFDHPERRNAISHGMWQALPEAARTLASEEQGLQVRYLQTLKEIANEKTNTIVFPMPLELVEPILHLTGSFNKKKPPAQ